MQSSSTSLTQTLVLIGGGHSHAIALKRWAMHPVLGVRVILITDVVYTPYSGMLPGYVAGLYTDEECHIDLRPLCQFANVQFVRDRAIELDLERNRVICQNHPPIPFDQLSIDIGSTPAASDIPGVEDYAIPAKPISKFLTQWDAMVHQVRQQTVPHLCLGVVGGGAGGVELALSLQGRLQSMIRKDAIAVKTVELHLFQRGTELLPGRHLRMRRVVQRTIQKRGIHLHLGESVIGIDPDLNRSRFSANDDEIGTKPYRVRCASGLTIPCDRIFWVTQASAAPWLQKSGLATDDQGFIQVNDYLQSTSHAQVFAAGDIATMINHPRPKAGVFAVRQGNPLFENLRRAVLKQPLKPFQPQQEFLILVGTGDEAAIASRGCVTLGPHRWIWRWKDRIDRAFMDRFTTLHGAMGQSPMNPHPEAHSRSVHPSPSPLLSPPASMHCAGCGSKVGSSVLSRVLHQLQQDFPASIHQPDVLLGLADLDDASAIAIPRTTTLIQTLDYFRALVDDPFIFGQIATNHCLNDLFAMGATPHSVLAIASLPYATPPIHEDMLYHLLSGALRVLHQAGAVLIGGHTVEGAELALGFACNGFLNAGVMLKKGGMQPGDRLILTKPLGTGTLFAAHMQLKARGHWTEGAIASMLQSNQAASQILHQYQVTACTDVSGFGLLGHLLEMVQATGNKPDQTVSLAVDLEMNTIPLLEGSAETIRQRCLSSLHPQNAQAFAQVQHASQLDREPLAPLLVDPQTAGGLLATIPAAQADACLSALRHQGYPHSQLIGTVKHISPGQPPISLSN